MTTHHTFDGLAHRGGRYSASTRELAAEMPVAISYNGTSHAVLMATPSDLADLAIGFSLSEGIISSTGEIEDIAIVESGRGLDIQLRLADKAVLRLRERRRSMAGPVGCGLCGIESIEQAMRDVPPVAAQAALSARLIADAVRTMVKAQSLNMRTRSVHAAGFYRPSDGLVAIREDVGRHNALDKLIGATAAGEMHMASGAIVLSSRLSVELVQKTAMAGCGILIAVSAPTALAVETADRANITLVAVVRDAEFELFTNPDRIAGGGLKHVA